MNCLSVAEGSLYQNLVTTSRSGAPENSPETQHLRHERDHLTGHCRNWKPKRYEIEARLVLLKRKLLWKDNIGYPTSRCSALESREFTDLSTFG